MWRLAILLVACAVLSACNSTPTASPNTPTSPVSPTAAGLACRLPVASFWSNGTNEQAGFVSIPSGSFTYDPASASGPFAGDVNDVTHPWKTAQTPVLFGDARAPGSRVTYDSADKRWLPVPRSQAWPDSTAYVYTLVTGGGAEVHRVAVATATDTIVATLTGFEGSGQLPARASYFDPRGIFLTSPSGDGLWLLDPKEGSIKSFPNASSYQWIVAAGSAWSVQPLQIGGGQVSLVQMDLQTGQLTTWQTIASKVQEQMGGGLSGDPTFSIIGFDSSGHPLVEIPAAFRNRADGQVRLVTTPLGSTSIDGLPQPANPPWYNSAAQFVTDEHGLWLGRSDGIYLYADGRFAKMAEPPFGNEAYDIVGPCEK